ncbi:MAG: tRNA lysidine(34) synthetase TilS, partial [Chloroflexi bacterium]|nr:tRNA lysidine(34) synthetase TilS [Chloroflexota bacterium]
MVLLAQVRNSIERHHLLARGDTVVVGVSGGPDSLCLLRMLLHLRDEYALTLHVAHLNHCLRGAEAEADATFVADLARDWGLPAHVESQDVASLAASSKLAIEEAARQARYAFLGRVALQVGAHKIAVGHNADDQVETILMHWLRGAGLAGLRGMRPKSDLGEMRLAGEELAPGRLLLIRPLLEVPRTDIEAYCAKQSLRPRFDRSNLDTTYYRNRLRHELLPFLETFNPGIRGVILRSAETIAADYELLKEEAKRAWGKVVVRAGDQVIVFNLAGWRALPLSLQRSTLREAIHHLRRSLRNINWIHVDNAVQVLQTGSTGMAVTLPSGLEARISYDEFMMAQAGYEEPLPDLPMLHGTEDITLCIPGYTALPGSHWSLQALVGGREILPAPTPRPAAPWEAYLDQDVTGNALCLRTR